jgi:FkbM family methyltransferase
MNVNAESLTYYNVRGTSFAFEDPRASIARDCVPGHSYEPLVAALLSDALHEPGARFVDIGALYGFFACWAARHTSDVSIAAFEPEPSYVDVMRRNVNRNNVNVQIIQAALVDRDEAVQFHGRTVEAISETKTWRRNYWKAIRVPLKKLAIGETTSDHIPLSSRGDSPLYTAAQVCIETWRDSRRSKTAVDESHTVEAMTFDTWVKGGGFSPTVVKIDVHGGEGLVLRGMQNALRTVRHVLLELHTPDYLIDTSIREVIELLEQAGLSLYELKGFRRSVGALIPLTPKRRDALCDIDTWSPEDLYFMRFLYAIRR